MTPQEMDISLKLELRKLNSNVYGNLETEEREWILNQAILKLIKNRISPKSNARGVGFQGSKKRYDDIEELITPKSLPLYFYDINSQIGILPSNYYLSAKISGDVAWDCKDIPITQGPTTLRYAIVPFPTTTTSPPYYPGLAIEVFNTSTGITSVWSSFRYTEWLNTIALGISDLRLTYELVNAIRDENSRRTDGLQVWWEHYHNIYAPNSFIISCGVNPGYTTVTVRQTGLPDEVHNFTGVAINEIQTTASLRLTKSPIDLIRTEDIDIVNSNSFGTTRYNNVLATMFDGYIRVYRTKRFILNSVDIEYIRKPRRISLLLNRSCELNERVHDEVITLATEIALDTLTQRKTVPAE